MSFLTSLGFKAAKVVEPNTPLPPVTISYQKRLITTNESDIKKVYQDSSVIQAAMNAWVSEFTSADVKPYIEDTPTDLEHLNLFTSSVMKEIIFHVLTSGTAFIYKMRSTRGQLVRIQILPAFHISKNYDKDGQFVEWSYRTSKGEYLIKPPDLIPITWFARSWDDASLGISPISSVIQQAHQMMTLNNFVTEQLDNDGVPRTVLSAPATMNLSEPQMKRVLEQVSNEFRTNNGALKILSGGWTVERLALGLDELDISALRSIPESDVASSFRIPIEYLGTATGNANSTYANKETSRKQFVSNVVSSMWNVVESIINENFSSEFVSHPKWYFERSNVAALQEDNTAKFQRLSALFTQNVISRREYRSELDLDDIDNGDDIYYMDILNADPLTHG